MRIVNESQHSPEQGRYKDTLVVDSDNARCYIYDSCGAYKELSDVETTISQTLDDGNTIGVYTNERNIAVEIKETITSITDNGDGTYSYINEAGDSQTVDIKTVALQCLQDNQPTFVQNNDNTWTYTPAFGGTPIVVQDRYNTIVDNGDSTWTATDQDGNVITIIDTDTWTEVVDNGDGTFSSTDPDGNTVTWDGAVQVVTSLVDNGDGTITYTDEAGVSNSIAFVNQKVVITDADLAVAGEPTIADLNTYVTANSLSNVQVCYLGDGVAGDPDYVWDVDILGTVTEVESPQTGGWSCDELPFGETGEAAADLSEAETIIDLPYRIDSQETNPVTYYNTPYVRQFAKSKVFVRAYVESLDVNVQQNPNDHNDPGQVGITWEYPLDMTVDGDIERLSRNRHNDSPSVLNGADYVTLTNWGAQEYFVDGGSGNIPIDITGSWTLLPQYTGVTPVVVANVYDVRVIGIRIVIHEVEVL